MITAEELHADIDFVTKSLKRTQKFLKQMQYYIAIFAVIISLFAYGLGYCLGHGVMFHDCQDIMSSALQVPSPIYAFKR